MRRNSRTFDRPIPNWLRITASETFPGAKRNSSTSGDGSPSKQSVRFQPSFFNWRASSAENFSIPPILFGVSAAAKKTLGRVSVEFNWGSFGIFMAT